MQCNVLPCAKQDTEEGQTQPLCSVLTAKSNKISRMCFIVLHQSTAVVYKVSQTWGSSRQNNYAPHGMLELRNIFIGIIYSDCSTGIAEVLPWSSYLVYLSAIPSHYW